MVWVSSTHREYEGLWVDTAPSLIIKFFIINSMRIFKILRKCKMPQVTILSKFHSGWRLSSRIRCFHFFMYFLVYHVNPFVSLTPVLRWPVPTAPLGGQRATCFTLVLLVYMDTWLRSSQSSTHSSSELFFLLQNRDFDLRPETVTSQKMVGTQVQSHTDAGLGALLHHVHTDKVTKPGLQGKRVKTLLEKQNEAPAKGERKEPEDAFLSSSRFCCASCSWTQ